MITFFDFDGNGMAIISFAQGKAAEDKTRGAMSAIKAGLERYKVRNGEYLNQWKIMVQVHRVL